MHNSHLHTIKRLKQQPRLGMAKKTISKAASDLTTELSSTYTNLKSNVGSITEIFQQQSQAMLSMQTDSANLATGINKLTGTLQGLNKGFLDNVEQITKVFARNNELIKSYGITEAAAQDMGFAIDVLSTELDFGREETEKYIKQLGNLTNGFIVSGDISSDFNKSLIKQQRYLTDIVGVSEEAAEAIMDMNAGIASRDVDKDGKVTAEQLENQLILRAKEAKAIEEATGLKGVQRTIDAEIAAAGSETSLQYSKMPKTLGLAVMKSKALGLSMEQMAKTGDELLNIESSVGNELEYQLLSGKRLVDNQGNSLTNLYRQATLQGDMNAQADVMKKIMDSQGDVLENNMLARKQLAATLGVEESTMAKMVQKRKLLKSMGAEELFNTSGDELTKKLKEMNVSSENIAEIMEQDDTRTTQDRMAESLRNIETKGILARFADKDDDDKITGYNKDAFKSMYTDSIAGIKTALSDYKTAIGATEDGLKSGAQTFFNFQEQVVNVVGSAAILNKSVTSVTAELTTLAGSIPIIGNKFTAAANSLKGFADKFTGDPLENMAIGSVTNLSVANGNGTQDGVMMHDGFVQFNPRDKFTRVNDGMTVAGTNVGGIDRFAAQMEKRDSRFEATMTRLISNMAAQMKQAVESANIKVDVDRTFSSNSMNKGRYA
jgi:hypothetical protein